MYARYVAIRTQLMLEKLCGKIIKFDVWYHINEKVNLVDIAGKLSYLKEILILVARF